MGEETDTLTFVIKGDDVPIVAAALMVGAGYASTEEKKARLLAYSAKLVAKRAKQLVHLEAQAA